jgi:hypothetical protein
VSGFRLISPLASSSSITTAEINRNSQPMDDREQGSGGNASTCDEPLAGCDQARRMPVLVWIKGEEPTFKYKVFANSQGLPTTPWAHPRHTWAGAKRQCWALY